MLRTHTKQFIIVLFQLTGIAIMTLVIAILMLKHTSSLNNWRDFFARFHSAFFIIHSMFYIVIYCLWPYLISAIAYRQSEPPTHKQINKAMHARYYLIGTFLIFELLSLLR